MASENCSVCRKSIFKEWLLASAVFVLWVAVFFYPAVFQGKLIYTADIFGSDLTDFNIPRRYLVAQAIKDGEFPQWEPLIGCGATVAAEGHPGFFYPFSTPINLLLPITAAANTAVFLALYLAFLGTYWLIRLYGTKPAPALLGAMAFAWGGALIFRLRHLNIIHVIAWMPVSFALLRLYLSSGRRVWWIGLVLTWSMQLLAGHPQFAYYSQMGYWLYIAAWFVFAQQTFKLRRQRLGILILAGIMALMLGAAQWLPTLELSQLSTRSELHQEQEITNAQSYQLPYLSCLINPYHLGSPAIRTERYPALMSENRPYWGTLPLLFILTAWGRRTRRNSTFWAVFFLFFFWLSLGPKGGLYALLDRGLPAFGLFRFPCRLLAPASLGIAILGALGADNACRWLSSKNTCSTTNLAGIALAVTALELGYTSCQFQGYLPKQWNHPPAILQAIDPQHQRLYAPLAGTHFSHLLVENGWRETGSSITALYNELPIDTSTIWNLAMAADQGFMADGLVIGVHSIFHNYLKANIEAGAAPHLRCHIAPPVLAALRFAGVSHIVSLEPLFTSHDRGVTDAIFTEPSSSTPFHIYRLDTPLPEARLVPELTATMPALYSACPVPYPVPLAQGLFEPDPEHPQNIGQCTAVAPTRNTYSVTTDCTQDSYLVLSRTYHPNWRVRLDGGEEQPLLLVNFAFQAVQVPAGRHRLEFRYNSLAQDLGLILSSVTIIILAIVVAWPQSRRLQAMAEGEVNLEHQ